MTTAAPKTPNAKHPLNGLRVLVTRPTNQAGGLIQALTQVGAQVIHYPVLEIKPCEPTSAQQQTLSQLSQYQALIFISTNAVRFLAQSMAQLGLTLPGSVQCIAIGKATADALKALGNSAIFPANAADSESLLELEALQSAHISAKKILIVRGEGGRETLKTSLVQRGANVQYLELYRRVTPQFSPQNPNPLPALLAQQKVDFLSVTSGQSLEYLTKLSGTQSTALKALPLVVPSARVADIAKRSGFKKLLQSRGARDSEIVERLIEWKSDLPI
ncbi:MAG: uroporphyrinogen-III synthase [Pseudomonadales bacterium]|nr:uroporphyrinogen-III synthase [Pseudomonadales bacterium]